MRREFAEPARLTDVVRAAFGPGRRLGGVERLRGGSKKGVYRRTGPLRLLDGDYPERELMREIAEANTDRALAFLAQTRLGTLGTVTWSPGRRRGRGRGGRRRSTRRCRRRRGAGVR